MRDPIEGTYFHKESVFFFSLSRISFFFFFLEMILITGNITSPLSDNLLETKVSVETSLGCSLHSIIHSLLANDIRHQLPLLHSYACGRT